MRKRLAPRQPATYRSAILIGAAVALLDGTLSAHAATPSADAINAHTWHWISAIVLLLAIATAICLFLRWRYVTLKRHTAELKESVRTRTEELDRSNRELDESNRELAAAIRDLEAAREQAVESERLAVAANGSKTKFLANVSHELRTPLNAIIGYAELLEEEARDRGDHDLIPQLGKIRFAARHLLSLINSILDLSKIEAGKMELYIESFDVRSIVDEVVTTLKPGIERDGNRFKLEEENDPGSMTSDPTKLRQMLYNLLSNANKFTNHGSIVLTLLREETGNGDRLTFRVSDTGIGMTPEQIDRIFQPFTQGDITMSRRFGGTGLGLAISRNLARLLGGDIVVESVAGEGAIFTLTLPATTTDTRERDSGA